MEIDKTLTPPNLDAYLEISKQYQNILEHVIKHVVTELQGLTKQYRKEGISPAIHLNRFTLNPMSEKVKVRVLGWSIGGDILTIQTEQHGVHPYSHETITVNGLTEIPARWLNLNILRSEYGSNLNEAAKQKALKEKLTRSLTYLDSDIERSKVAVDKESQKLKDLEKQKRSLKRKISKL